jgi:diguanylate cyclase (GGDEF)-like protein
VLEHQLAHQATHDDLTGLPNRALFRERLEQALISSRREGQQYAVFFIDLDHFKDVNDSWGHDTGDRLLVAATGRLRSCLRDVDTLARLGGDEFAVLLPDVPDRAAVVQTAEQLLAALAAPLALTGPDYAVTASIGIVLASGQYGRPEDVLRHADVALYRAKETGRAGYKVFDPEMQAALTARLDLERDLRLAIKRDEFVLHYQPIVDLHTEQIVAAEALLRWQHPTRGMVAPLDFIPLAEETGMIREIDRWVLRTACQQAYAWYQQDLGAAPLVSVNLSPLTFRLPELGQMVAATLAAVGLPAWQLKLEITEGTAMENAASTVATLGELKGLGVRLGIDDFGTGYSSLAYLKRFPVDTLKIDKTFVDGLGQDPDDTAIVRTVLTLAHSLGLQVTAEGLETIEQLRFLRALGCEHGQGYHFSRALPAEAFAAFRDRASLTLPQSLFRD